MTTPDIFPSEAMVESLEGRLQNFQRLNRELLEMFERLAANGDGRLRQLFVEFVARESP